MLTSTRCRPSKQERTFALVVPRSYIPFLIERLQNPTVDLTGELFREQVELGREDHDARGQSRSCERGREARGVLEERCEENAEKSIGDVVDLDSVQGALAIRSLAGTDVAVLTSSQTHRPS